LSWKWDSKEGGANRFLLTTGRIAIEGLYSKRHLPLRISFTSRGSLRFPFRRDFRGIPRHPRAAI